jgi:hypothetical protein
MINAINKGLRLLMSDQLMSDPIPIPLTVKMLNGTVCIEYLCVYNF